VSRKKKRAQHRDTEFTEKSDERKKRNEQRKRIEQEKTRVGSAGKREFSMTNEERKAALEAIIYAADEPATIEQLAKALGEEKLVVQASLDELVAS
jgi:transcriptional antiterminator